MIMQVGVAGRRDLVYINPANGNGYVDIDAATNFSDIEFKDGMNFACIHVNDDGTFYIIQYSGYNLDDGLYCVMV